MKPTKRALSFVIAAAMMTPTLASGVDAATANWLSPQPGQQITTANVEVAVGYNTQSSTKVTRLELWVDGKMHARKDLISPEPRGVCSFWWDTTRYSNGPHELVVKVYSGDTLISTVNSTGTVGNTALDLDPPVVTFSGIKSGDVLKGTTQIKMEAKDNSGDPPLVSLLVDDSLKLVKNRAPYIYALDTTVYTDGSHELETYAYDNAGNKSNPAVIKVSFKNNAQRPVVTSLTVAPSSGVAASEDDGANVIVKSALKTEVSRNVETSKTKPVIAKEAAPRPVSSSAGRVAPVRPVVVAEASTPIKIASKVTAQPRIEQKPESVMRVAKPTTPSAEETSVKTPEVIAKARALAAKPIPVIAKPPAELASIAEASQPVGAVTAPSTRAESRSVASKPAAAVEPNRAIGVDTSSPKPVLMAKAPSIREGAYAGMASVSGGAQEVVSDPVSADMRGSVVPDPSAAIRSDRLVGRASVSKRVAMAPPMDKTKLPKTKTVPYIDDATARAKVKTSIKQLPDARLLPDAKLEKKVIPASGKVKLRDLINRLGGVVFWDPASHTVTAYVGDLHLELVIGSHKALVNGKEMRVDHAPFVANGRTVINAQVYHQAMAFVAGNGKVASVE